MTQTEKLKSARTALLEGHWEQAQSLFQDILLEESHNLEALDGMGVLCCQQGDSEQGIHFFKEAVRFCSEGQALSSCKVSDLSESRAILLFHLGLALRSSGNHGEAIESFLGTLSLLPEHTESILNLGQIYFETADYDRAAECFRRLNQIQPEDASALLTLGYIHFLQGKFTEAINVLLKTMELDPQSPEACYYLAESLRNAERYEESVPYYQKLLHVASDWPQAVHGYGKTLLALGHLKDGWEAMEFRMASSFGAWERHVLPNWSGESDEDKTVLAYAEEGIAAEIMFASCLPELINSVRECVVECESSLHQLFKRSFPRAKIVEMARETIGQVAADGSPGHSYKENNPWGLSLDEQVAFGSLPRFFRQTHEDFPLKRAYLVPDKDRVEKWYNRLAELGSVAKVGFLWQGIWTAEKEDKVALPKWELRNMMLRHQADAAWVCLQHGSRQKELDSYRRNVSLRIHLFKEAFQYDLDEMAALLSALDLVITPPGYVAHLAGALGVRTWLVLPAGADWRWKLGRSDALWHQTMQMYRQKKGQDWQDLFQTLGEDLERFLASYHPPEEDTPDLVPFPAREVQNERKIFRVA